MKYSKRYIVFGVLVAAMLIFKLETGARGAERWKILPASQLAGGNLNLLIASMQNDICCRW